jgi:hypothetical protein
MGLLYYTTKVSAEQTIGEIQQKLARYGVNAMMTEYDGRNVSAVSFRMNINGQQISFKMPCNWRSVLSVFKAQHVTRNELGDGIEAQAIRTAWRIILAWVESQLALVEVNMATVQQIFLPYAIMKDGRTLGEHVEESPSFLLGTGN